MKQDFGSTMKAIFSQLLKFSLALSLLHCGAVGGSMDNSANSVNSANSEKGGAVVLHDTEVSIETTTLENKPGPTFIPILTANSGNIPLETGGSLPKKDVGTPDLGVSKIQACVVLGTDHLRFHIWGQIKDREGNGSELDDRILRIVAPQEGKFVETMTRQKIILSARENQIDQHGFYDFEMTTEKQPELNLYLMKREYQPDTLDKVLDLELPSIWLPRVEHFYPPAILGHILNNNIKDVGPCSFPDLPMNDVLSKP